MEDIFDIDSEPEAMLKIIMLGNAAVGKTNLVERYVKDVFDNQTKPTIGIFITFLSAWWPIFSSCCKLYKSDILSILIIHSGKFTELEA